MGVYIKNQEIPTSCTNCFYAIDCKECIFKDIVLTNDEIIFHIGSKSKDCPLIEIEDNKIKQLL